MNIGINDRFMNPNVHGYSVMPFKLDGNRLPREDISINVISRSNSRSMGKAMYKHTNPCNACGGELRRVYNNKCYTCWRLIKKPLD